MGSRVKEEERNEKIIRGLLKLPGNRRCINCNSLGPQYVCTSFSTFICTNCSGIHREFTHRVKSISVAKFTSQEVSALQEGGNERAKEIYFKHWDIQGQSVIDNSDVDGLRTFIKNVYVEQRYTGQRIGDHLPQAKKSTSQWTNDPRPGSMQDAKLYVSENLIDFDSDLEPPQDVVQTKIQKNPLPPTDIGWATFDVATPQNTTTMTSTFSTNSLEGSMLQIPNSASMPQSRLPTVQTAKSLSFSLANHGSQQHQHYFSPVNNIQSSNPPLNRTTSAPVDSQLWRAASHAPMLQGNSILPSNQGSNILIGNRDPVTVSASQQLLADITSNGRKALPEDIFTMSYRPVSSSWNWQPNPRVNMGYGQYGTHYPVGITQHAHPYNINPVNLARGPTSAHASSRFPSLTSMQEALPNVASTALLPHAPGMGSVGSVLSPRQVAFPSTADSNQYMIQQHAVKVQNDTFPIGYGVRGFATTATAYGLSPMDQHLAAQNALPRVGGNPFA
ncbi:probable ADP-ribosylation factor GTPase-activating protein AGD14 isoform X4 [Phragmites australis]|uniref:probable ADP-ribosylation factor GTPase-activating protein AGD14 isoform X4 n=1 Tax=Phragmites australis TaxID=29695 RepID=UPI002D79BED9|nr:probable ADP-ribosylation factor GTPase-activating protein AGD14 isoform X4 [Phragmites australis]